MAAGLAVVASDVGGVPEQIDHMETGVLVPPESPSALAAWMVRLHDDAALRASLGTAAAAAAKRRFSLESQARGLHRIYLAALNLRHGPPVARSRTREALRRMKATGLSVVIVAWNSASDLPTCLASLQASALRSAIDLHTVVIDNASDDDSAGVAERGGADFVLRNPLNAGFAVAASQGLALSVHPWVFLANADLDLAPDALGRLLSAAHAAGEDVASLIPDVRFRADPQIVNTRGIEVDRYGIPFESSAGQPASDLPLHVPFGGTGGACLFGQAPSPKPVALSLLISPTSKTLTSLGVCRGSATEPSSSTRRKVSISAPHRPEKAPLSRVTS